MALNKRMKVKRGVKEKKDSQMVLAAGKHASCVRGSWKNQTLSEVVTRANMNVWSSLHTLHLEDLFS